MRPRSSHSGADDSEFQKVPFRFQETSTANGISGPVTPADPSIDLVLRRLQIALGPR